MKAWLFSAALILANSAVWSFAWFNGYDVAQENGVLAPVFDLGELRLDGHELVLDLSSQLLCQPDLAEILGCLLDGRELREDGTEVPEHRFLGVLDLVPVQNTLETRGDVPRQELLNVFRSRHVTDAAGKVCRDTRWP